MALYVEPRVIRQRWFADPDRDEAVRGVICDEDGVVAFVTRCAVHVSHNFDPPPWGTPYEGYVRSATYEIRVERCRTRRGYRWEPKDYAATFLHSGAVYEFPRARFTGVGCYEAQFAADEGSVRVLPS